MKTRYFLIRIEGSPPSVLLPGHNSQIERAFTLLELLVVLTITGVLAALLLPSLAKARGEAKTAACLGNLRQLQAAYLMYVHDNHDWLPQNISRLVFPDQVNLPGSWMLGNAAIDATITNLQAGTLFQYLHAVPVYHCPADHATVTGHPGLKRTRSYSIQLWLNSNLLKGTYADTAITNALNLRKYSRIVDPPPAKSFVFIDEHEKTIGDGVFMLANPWAFPGGPDFWASLPADRHGDAGNLAFADGHAETHRWRFHRTNLDKPEQAGQQIIITDPNDRLDLHWLQQGIPHTP